MASPFLCYNIHISKELSQFPADVWQVDLWGDGLQQRELDRKIVV